MAKIQIADLHSENVVELTAEEQYLIQGGFFWIPFLIKAAAAAVRTYSAGRTFGWW
ncbi:hypothetical protein H6G25_18180 [Dolichospermum sp. FACHB-1091]|uniref:hypothetical protein n=1 Tax=Dolichospermum sp. FACHB-1091 TaxID=2692798 RepID=UPI0016818D1A|nr:hypothetical protein [Dolichospermum sp. FACHB-1091]MBD2445075.1 hypothetical protein [Dolichospermum sp. FACHB-1091]